MRNLLFRLRLRALARRWRPPPGVAATFGGCPACGRVGVRLVAEYAEARIVLDRGTSPRRIRGFLARESKILILQSAMTCAAYEREAKEAGRANARM